MELKNNYPTLSAPTPDPKEYIWDRIWDELYPPIFDSFSSLSVIHKKEKKYASWHRDILFYTISLPSLFNVWNEIVITIVKGEKNFWLKKTFLCFFIPLFKIYIVFSLYLFICLKGYVVVAFIYVFPLFLCF